MNDNDIDWGGIHPDLAKILRRRLENAYDKVRADLKLFRETVADYDNILEHILDYGPEAAEMFFSAVGVSSQDRTSIVRASDRMTEEMWNVIERHNDRLIANKQRAGVITSTHLAALLSVSDTRYREQLLADMTVRKWTVKEFRAEVRRVRNALGDGRRAPEPKLPEMFRRPDTAESLATLVELAIDSLTPAERRKAYKKLKSLVA